MKGTDGFNRPFIAIKSVEFQDGIFKCGSMVMGLRNGKTQFKKWLKQHQKITRGSCLPL